MARSEVKLENEAAQSTNALGPLVGLAREDFVSAVALLLRTVLTVFEDFTYHRQLVSADGRSVVLEFSARVGEKQLKGIDLIQFDADGLITDFEVMIRPMSGLQALGAEMGARLGHLLPVYKAAT